MADALSIVGSLCSCAQHAEAGSAARRLEEIISEQQERVAAKVALLQSHRDHVSRMLPQRLAILQAGK